MINQTPQEAASDPVKSTEQWTYIGNRLNHKDELRGVWVPYVVDAFKAPETMHADSMWFMHKSALSGVVGGVYDIECSRDGEGSTTMYGFPIWTSEYAGDSDQRAIWQVNDMEAKDRKAAFTAATAGQTPAPLTCMNAVKDQFNLGVKLGVNGTPAIYGPDGRTLGGYVTPEQLLQALKQGG